MSCFKQWLVMLTKIKIKFVICELFTVPKFCEFVFPLKKDLLVLCLVIEFMNILNRYYKFYYLFIGEIFLSFAIIDLPLILWLF